MPIERDRFELIKRKHGAYASWAVWAPPAGRPKSNTGVLSFLDPDSNPSLLQLLNPAVVMVGLNISRPLDEAFRNFHDPSARAQDFKLRSAFNGTRFYGGYMTDVVKNVEESKSSRVRRYLRNNPAVVDLSLRQFRTEIADLGCEKPTILAFGQQAYDLLFAHLKSAEYQTLVPLRHYACYVGMEEYRATVARQCTALGVNATHVVHSGGSGNNGGCEANPVFLEDPPNESSS